MTFDQKSKVHEINSHGERGVTGLQTLLYRPFRDAPKIMFISAGRNLRYPFLSCANKFINKFRHISISFCTQAQVYMSILVSVAWVILRLLKNLPQKLKTKC